MTASGILHCQNGVKSIKFHAFTKSVSAYEVGGPSSVFKAMCVEILRLCV